MKKEILLEILNKYLSIFPEEKKRQNQLKDFIEKYNDDEITDWNNFDGHIVASGLIYAKLEKKFLALHHKDMNIFVFPGGHVDKNDINPLATAKREILEETGIDKLDQRIMLNNELFPFDIDTHLVGYNKRLDLPEHYHYVFRYLFTIDKVLDISLDKDESSEYKWKDIEDLKNQSYYNKLKNILNN